MREIRWHSSSRKADEVITSSDSHASKPIHSTKLTIEVVDNDEDIMKQSESLELDRSLYTDEVLVRIPDITDDGQAKVLKWFKKEGDIVKYGDLLCDIETKGTVSFS